MLKEVDEISDEIIQIRRQLHKFPEVRFDLERTCLLVKSKLESYGISVNDGYGRSSIVGEIVGLPGKTIALRADMDALDLREESSAEYKSQISGKMHGCGHDGHTAMLLGVAKILSRNRDKIHGTVRLIFQASEEGPESGAKLMVKDGVTKGVDEIYGLHLSTSFDLGEVILGKEHVTASSDVFEIELKGKGGHAALPHESVDALAMGVQLVNDIQYMVSREVDPLEPVVVSVGKFHSGTASNVIPEKAMLTGTIRACTPRVREQVIGRLEELTENIALVSKGESQFILTPGLPPLINNRELADKSIHLIETILGKGHVQIAEKPFMGAEDFAYFTNDIPGVFIFIGARNEEKGFVKLLHNPSFDFDEKALSIGMKVLLQHVIDM